MAADLFQLSRLKYVLPLAIRPLLICTTFLSCRDLCSRELTCALDPLNAPSLYEVATQYGAEQLRQAALDFMMHKWKDVAANLDESAPVTRELMHLHYEIFGDEE